MQYHKVGIIIIEAKVSLDILLYLLNNVKAYCFTGLLKSSLSNIDLWNK